MNNPAMLFEKSDNLESFRNGIIGLGGVFPFERDDMIELGEKYFERYPECYSNRDCSTVQIGYQIVRICIIEKLVEGMPESAKSGYRKIFTDVSSIKETVERLVRANGADSVMRDYKSISEKADAIRTTIDTIPVGMVKERFVGGVSNIYNILYLLKTSLSVHTG
ncbi:MAG: hypothetical protein MUD12_13660 [Spirochaetes bacterium]|jgi:hypothetical protein|nr:hypothetical protein [Spirochaetota bacterium]